MIRYKANPFFLSDSDIAWVENTFREMTLEEKIGQLFCPVGSFQQPEQICEVIRRYHIGGVLYRPGKAKDIQQKHRLFQQHSKIPLLIASNLETGGCGAAEEGTFYGRQMLAAATGDPDRAYQLGKVSCAEGAAVGVNWSFAPVADIDLNYENPITNVRTFGSDAERVMLLCSQYLKAAKEENVAVAIKHFPGDGVDNRDQHLVTSVNSLTCEQWDRTYGKVYRELIERGALSVMAGHIAMPAYEAFFDGTPCTQVIPATLSGNLLQKLLRERLGFNGLVCTDATNMIGFLSAMERCRAVPLAIENGCDVFLFNVDLEKDYTYMLEGYKNGLLSETRLDEAVKRILCTKAAIKLHEKQKMNTLVPGVQALDMLNCTRHALWAQGCAEEGITLVKDTGEILPLNPQKHKRLLLLLMGEAPSNARVENTFAACLEAEGFQVHLYSRECEMDLGIRWDDADSIKAGYDALLYVSNMGNGNYKTNARLNWTVPFKDRYFIPSPWFAGEVPVVFVSVGNPYCLLDAPMASACVNCYCNSDYVIRTAVKKLVGSSAFRGVSPIDPFCGKWDAHIW